MEQIWFYFEMNVLIGSRFSNLLIRHTFFLYYFIFLFPLLKAAVLQISLYLASRVSLI